MTKLNPTKLRSVAELARFCVHHPQLTKDSLLRQVLGIAIRKLHDFGESKHGRGKYLGHPYWSRDARGLLRRNGGRVEGIEDKLSHEHVIPVSLMVEKLLSLPKATTTMEFEKAITDLTLVAIITRAEDVDLRKAKIRRGEQAELIDGDPWARYRQAKLLSKITGRPRKAR